VDEEPLAAVGLAAAEAAVARAKLAIAERHAYAPDGSLIHPQLLDMYRKRADATERFADEPDAFMRVSVPIST